MPHHSHGLALCVQQGGNSIPSSIDCTVVTLGASTNASRIVSYLVVRVERYCAQPMVDMRTQDITLTVDLRGTPPWVPEQLASEEPVPVESDGTSIGYKPCDAAVNFVNTIISCTMTETLGVVDWLVADPAPEIYQVDNPWWSGHPAVMD